MARRRDSDVRQSMSKEAQMRKKIYMNNRHLIVVVQSPSLFREVGEIARQIFRGVLPSDSSPSPQSYNNHDHIIRCLLEVYFFFTFSRIIDSFSLRLTNAAFTLNGFDNQERNLTFVKTDFQVSKLKFYACNFKLAFYPLHKLHIA